MTQNLNDEERKAVPLAIRGWLEIGFTEKEKKIIAAGLLTVGILGGDIDQALYVALKMGIGDLIEGQTQRLCELAGAGDSKP